MQVILQFFSSALQSNGSTEHVSTVYSVGFTTSTCIFFNVFYIFLLGTRILGNGSEARSYN